MPKFRKKPVIIEAIRYLGNGNVEGGDVPDWMWEALKSGVLYHTANERFAFGPLDAAGSMTIKTLEGTMVVSPGDWIIRGIKAELYPCKPDIFAATYEQVEETPDAE